MYNVDCRDCSFYAQNIILMVRTYICLGIPPNLDIHVGGALPRDKRPILIPQEIEPESFQDFDDNNLVFCRTARNCSRYRFRQTNIYIFIIYLKCVAQFSNSVERKGHILWKFWTMLPSSFR